MLIINASVEYCAAQQPRLFQTFNEYDNNRDSLSPEVGLPSVTNSKPGDRGGHSAQKKEHAMKTPAGLALATSFVAALTATCFLWMSAAPDGGFPLAEQDGLVTLRAKDKLAHAVPEIKALARLARSSRSDAPRAVQPALPEGPAPVDVENQNGLRTALNNRRDPLLDEQAELKRRAESRARHAEALAALDNEDPQVRMAAIEFVEPARNGLKKLIWQTRHDPDETNRVQAVEQLAKGQGVEITNALVGALQDPSTEVVLGALDALQHSQDYTIAENVKSALEARAEPQVQEKLKETLQTLSSSAPTWDGTDYTNRRVIVMASGQEQPAD